MNSSIEGKRRNLEANCVEREKKKEMRGTSRKRSVAVGNGKGCKLCTNDVRKKEREEGSLEFLSAGSGGRGRRLGKDEGERTGGSFFKDSRVHSTTS